LQSSESNEMTSEERMSFGPVGVIGAGVMGVGVAQDLAQTGHRVILIDMTDEILEAARRQLTKHVRFHHLVKRDAERQDVAEVIERIRFSRDYGLLAGADFVIENVTEDWDLKQSVYRDLDGICSPECPFAANTSAIPISRIAAATDRASRVLGMHFMNPVPLKPAVEVIRGRHTSDATIEEAEALLTRMGKEAIIVNDSPGFVSNRVLMLTINESVSILHEGVATAETIDAIFKRCFAHEMGPLETADLIGLDTVLQTLRVLSDAVSGSKYWPCPLLESMVDSGLLGRKSGQGFYRYEGGEPLPAG
jgi:3-hydroxybutyryl-CoA dehydrogenase